MASTYGKSLERQGMNKDLCQLVNLGINAEESSLVVKVKEKQYTDPILLQLKENVLHGMTKHLSL